MIIFLVAAGFELALEAPDTARALGAVDEVVGLEGAALGFGTEGTASKKSLMVAENPAGALVFFVTGGLRPSSSSEPSDFSTLIDWRG
jgi:hypothetical protein